MPGTILGLGGKPRAETETQTRMMWKKQAGSAVQRDKACSGSYMPCWNAGWRVCLHTPTNSTPLRFLTISRAIMFSISFENPSPFFHALGGTTTASRRCHALLLMIVKPTHPIQTCVTLLRGHSLKARGADPSQLVCPPFSQ